MSKATQPPKLIHDVTSYKIVQEHTFNLPLAELFEPKDGSLRFFLKNKKIPWLHLASYCGRLHGIAPNVPYTKNFPITVTVSNEMGHLIKDFVLTVIDNDIVEVLPTTLEFILTRRKDEEYRKLVAHERELLEFLYYFFDQESYRARFERSIRDAAKERNIKITSDHITYHDFKSVINAINPNTEHFLRETFVKDEAMTKIKLSHTNLRNLYRQGSQPMGTIVIPVWNHLAAPDLHDWSSVSNVLDAAAEAIHKQELQNQQHVPR